jgi:mannitol/fructose-specific phosphotransferase system IIA component (Ntr-type)
MKISELLSQNLIKTDLAGVTKEGVFGELMDLLQSAKLVKDRDSALAAIMERENKQSTGIGRGVAIPHGKTSAVKELVAAMGISKQGFEYDSLDGEPVHVVFLLLAEEGKPGPHVLALAQIATLFKVPGFIEKLVNAKSPRELYDIIVREEEREA